MEGLNHWIEDFHQEVASDLHRSNHLLVYIKAVDYLPQQKP